MTENERETEDNGSEGHKGCKCVASIEDEQADEDKYKQRDGKHHSVELCDGGSDILETGCESFPFSIDPTDGLAHFTFRYVTVSILIEQGKRGSL